MPSCSFGELEVRSVQRIKTYTIEERVYNRIPFDKERTCTGCGVRPGQLHIPGCEEELCPACRGLAAICGCAYDYPDDRDDGD